MPNKPDLALGWKFVEKLLREEDIERLDQASDEEVERQLRAAGIDPEKIPTADEMLARATERARQRNEKGIDPAKIVPLRVRPKRNAWVVWVAAALIAAVAVTLAVERRELEAWWQPRKEPIGPDPQKPPTPQERAAKVRVEAFAACGDALWALCGRKLDEARELDPEGENDARVQGARKAAYEGLHSDDGRKRGK